MLIIINHVISDQMNTHVIVKVKELINTEKIIHVEPVSIELIPQISSKIFYEDKIIYVVETVDEIKHLSNENFFDLKTIFKTILERFYK